MDDFQSKQLANPRNSRRTCLVTYSQADLNKFPSRESFGQMLEEQFNTGTGKAKVSHWACCLEEHQDKGVHYHVSLKLTAPKKWLKIKNDIIKKHNVTVHFSDNHDNYIAAYRYVCKTDDHVVHSIGHPDLSEVGSPKTKNSTKAYRESRKRAHKLGEEKDTMPCKQKSSRPKRLTNVEVSDFLVKHKIKRDTELFAVAKVRKDQGQMDMANFILSKSSSVLNELIDKTWKMQTANEDLQRKKKSRMEILCERLSEDCSPGCDKLWLECAIEVLRNNKIHPFVYAAAIRDLLINGRGKFRNLMIIGPANCGKTFMFKPLSSIYNVFSKPANDKYAWVGADSAEVIVLQDFRWSHEMIPWSDLLLLLEGETVKLPAPKNQFFSDVVIEKDTPIFATSKSRIAYAGKFHSSDERETEMMAIRWKVIEFKHQIPESEQKQVSQCVRCFSELALLGEEDI
ncbi:hypothetical protein DSY43_02735 [Paramuricea clavata]|uniref:Uncharacterized protein n=1 Tax=Paramuricea clavata TaxID=317549 RepID=A0A7D9DZI7_PARCT|nr:hypothetical protein DSY43_02735 [Paramuricea clavata]